MLKNTALWAAWLTLVVPGVTLAAPPTASPSSSAVAQPSFDCGQASEAAEIAICQDSHLAAADRSLDAAYRAALAASSNPAALRDEQRRWLGDVRSCGSDPYCLHEAYADRIAELEGFPINDVEETAPPEPPATTSTGEVRVTTDSDKPIQGTRDNHEQTGTPEPSGGEAPSAGGIRALLAADNNQLALMWAGVLAATVIAVLLLVALARRTSERYGWPIILNWWNGLYVVGALGGMALFGLSPLVGIGVFLAAWLVMLIVNVSKTDLLTGIVTTLVQPFALLIIVFTVAMVTARPKRVSLNG